MCYIWFTASTCNELQTIHGDDILNSFDSFIAESFELSIKQNIETKVFRKIERRLLSLYKLTVAECISDFSKIDGVMREVLGPATDKLEKNLIKAVITVSSVSKNSVLLNDKTLSEKILLSYGDKDKKTILELLYDDSFLLYDIQNNTGIPQATVYRRTRELIDDGLIVENGHELSSDNKPVPKYTTLFSRITINAKQNNYDVQVTIKENFLKSSMLYRIAR